MYEILKKSRIKKKKMSIFCLNQFCITEDNNKSISKIGSYKFFPKKRMIEYLLYRAHKSTISYLKKREMVEYLSSKLNVS